MKHKTLALMLLLSLVPAARVPAQEKGVDDETESLAQKLVLLTAQEYASPTGSDDVRAAMMQLLEAYNTGDVQSIAALYLPGATSFLYDGGLLAEFDWEILQAAYEAGLQTQLAHRHLRVDVHGDAAVATAYMTGTIAPAGTAMPEHGTWRVSIVWIRKGQSWKVAHGHVSRLVSGHGWAQGGPHHKPR